MRLRDERNFAEAKYRYVRLSPIQITLHLILLANFLVPGFSH